MQAHRLAANFSNDIIVSKIGSVVFQKKNEILRKVQKLSKGSRKKKKKNQQIPYIFITPVVFKQNLTLAKNISALYAIKLPLRVNTFKLDEIEIYRKGTNEPFYLRLRLE